MVSLCIYIFAVVSNKLGGKIMETNLESSLKMKGYIKKELLTNNKIKTVVLTY